MVASLKKGCHLKMREIWETDLMLIVGDRNFSAQAHQSSLRVQGETTYFDLHQRELAFALDPAELSNSARLQRAGLKEERFSMEDHGIVLDQKAENTWLVEKSGVDFGEKFLKLSEMTIAERLRFFFLEDREMTEDDLKAMSEKDRQAIEDQIRHMIMAALGWDDDEYDAAFGKYLSSQGEAGSTGQAGGGDSPDNLGQIDADPMLALLAGTQVSTDHDDT
ncbi:hypothetical protein N7E02_25920 [Aliirhizobium terrae]|uniref:hypothetical protein n=1 Tax=Terrirhizobium terrae TaxID=2926709 RepID=UPI0025784E35|nr:hypothetical protein [Rhizobium sp. CC-CFT758]WJH40052.1 hypothetical protein N7E02_25920 [Rhizobium sp. CC-CFT758]